MTNHLRLDLNLVELLAGVDTNNATNHLGDDNHVTEVSLHKVGLLVGLSLLLGLAELLDQAHGAALKTAVDPAAGTGVDDIAELVGAEVQKATEISWLAGLSSSQVTSIVAAVRQRKIWPSGTLPIVSLFQFVVAWASCSHYCRER